PLFSQCQVRLNARLRPPLRLDSEQFRFVPRTYPSGWWQRDVRAALLGIGSYHLDRIRMKLPRTSVEGFELLGRSLCGLRRTFRITDINSLLQALEWVPVGAEQRLEEANVVCGHGTPPYYPQHTLNTLNAAAEY